MPTDKPNLNILLKKYDGTFKIFDETFYKIWKGNQEFGDFVPSNATYQNIYITSDEEIRLNDACLHPTTLNISKHHIVGNNLAKGWKKIILTTDEELINDGVQAIDYDFLKWFVKNPTCELVEYEEIYNIGNREYLGNGSFSYTEAPIPIEYKLIIPKEEPKQETFEEATERLYSEEDLERAWLDGRRGETETVGSYPFYKTTFKNETFKTWFEQFKKK